MTVLDYCDDSSKQNKNKYNLGGIFIRCNYKGYKYLTISKIDTDKGFFNNKESQMYIIGIF